MNTCNGIDGGFTPTGSWLLVRERRTAAKGPLCSGCCAIRRGPCRCTACRHRPSMIKDSDRATRLPLWGLTALGTRGRGPRSGRAWSSQGLLVAIHTWSSSGAARKLQTTNYLAKIRVGKITTLKMVKQLSLSDLQVALYGDTLYCL